MKVKKQGFRSLLMGVLMGVLLVSAVGCEEDETKSATDLASVQMEDEEEKDNSGIYGTAMELASYDVGKSNFQLVVDASNEVHEISDLLYGIFFEDINFAADGGLYAEMVQNRSFEFTKLASNNQMHAWNEVGVIQAEVIVDDLDGALNVNNPSYVVLKNENDEIAGIENIGFLDGMSIEQDAQYDFSLYAKGQNEYQGSIYVDLMVDGKSVASSVIENISDVWEKYELTLQSSVFANQQVTLCVRMDKGTCDLDMISLFPRNTYLGRENGLRKDLAEKLEALEPSFLRFPGGCVIEGVTLELAYDWKDSIGVDENGDPLYFNGTYGDVAARSMGQNIWTDERSNNDKNPSFMTYGLGFYEYFLLAEDIGAIGVPVVNAGLCCMAQGNGSGPAVGTDAFDQYVQDALDLVEFCRGDETTTWGAVRIAMGHEEPFALKYIGIGNEQWGDSFYAHYEAFVDAFAQARIDDPKMFDDIELIFTPGPDDADSGYTMYMDAYEEAYDWLLEHPESDIAEYAGATDHHYYNDPEWFLKHVDYYDEENYTRNVDEMLESPYGGGIRVFLGEYAARSNTWKAALAEAAYMTGLEKNGDIVVMSAYAPLFGNTTATHWSPDLIWFDNHSSVNSVNYYTQQIFSTNAGTTLLSSDLFGAQVKSEGFKGKVGVATWETSATFDNLIITDHDTGEIIASQTFDEDTLMEWEEVSDGEWSVYDGELIQGSESTDTRNFGNTGTAAYFGDSTWTNYTYSLDATKTGGREGFLIPVAVDDEDNHIFWNIGGWGNTVSCLQIVSDGVKSGQVGGTIQRLAVKTGQTYRIKIEVTDRNIKCYLDDKLYVDYDLIEGTNAEAYQVVSTDETGDVIIKLVNVTDMVKTFAIDLQNANLSSETASVEFLAGKSLNDDNVLGQEEVIFLEETLVQGISNQFNFTVPAYSVTVLRMKTQ